MLIDDNGFEMASGVPTFIGVLILAMGFFITFTYFIITANGDYSKAKQEEFTKSLRKAVIAYSKQYSYDLGSLEGLSEGYIIDEDFNKHAITSNPINIDVPRAKAFFYRILEGSTPYSKTELNNMNLYVGQIITEFSPTKKYTLTLYQKGNNPVINKRSYRTTAEMQSDIESLLGVTLDINTRFNSSIRKAQEYEKSISNGKYSTYTTYMVIGVRIPVKSLYSNDKFNFYELQTYSIYR